MEYCLSGFNGERPDPVSGHYHLGNGYRAYNSALRRFTCPDSWSPFGAGGNHPYTYCAGDPVNHADPSGHINWSAVVSIVTGVVGLMATAISGGLSIAAAGSVIAALNTASVTSLTVGLLMAGSDVAAIESGAAALAVQGKLSSALGWLSLGLGVAAGAGRLAWAGVRRVAGLPREGIELLPVNRVNIHPSGGGPLQYYKAFSIEPHYRSDLTFEKYNIAGFFSDIKSTGEPGLVLHSAIGRNVQMGYTPGLSTFRDLGGTRALMFKSAERLTEHIRETFNIDLKTVGKGPLHLLTCYSGGKEGLAQTLANYLKRPVISYVSESERLNFNPMNILGNESAELFINRSEHGNEIYDPAVPVRYIPDSPG